jgi:large subunit ribosomal protein L15
MATPETTTEPFGLHNLSPADGSHRERKRVGRGTGSGNGKTAGRGQKGQKSRSGSHNMRAGFIGGQNPLHMQVGKQRGPHKKTSMPMGPFRTTTQPVNLRDLERRFSAGDQVTPESLLASGLLRHLRHPVKILGVGELTKALSVEAHGFSASAKQKIEAAGGSASLLGAPAAEAAAELAVSEATPAEAIEGAAPPEAVAPDADETPEADEVEADAETGDEA